MVMPVTPTNRRHDRLAVNLPARAVGREGEFDAVLQDISESGAAVGVTGAGAAALFTNEAFVELQVEGHEAYEGRVVRQFAGGYALEFDHTEAERKHMRDEIKKFEAVVSRGKPLEA